MDEGCVRRSISVYTWPIPAMIDGDRRLRLCPLQTREGAKGVRGNLSVIQSQASAPPDASDSRFALGRMVAAVGTVHIVAPEGQEFRMYIYMNTPYCSAPGKFLSGEGRCQRLGTSTDAGHAGQIGILVLAESLFHGPLAAYYSLVILVSLNRGTWTPRIRGRHSQR